MPLVLLKESIRIDRLTNLRINIGQYILFYQYMIDTARTILAMFVCPTFPVNILASSPSLMSSSRSSSEFSSSCIRTSKFSKRSFLITSQALVRSRISECSIQHYQIDLFLIQCEMSEDQGILSLGQILGVFC